MGGINVFAEPTFTKDGSAVAVFPGSFSVFGGAEFFFTNHFGLMLEGGYSDYTPDVNVGLVFRF